jgi:hypothetical protein
MLGSDSRIDHQRGGRYTMSAPASITITPVFVADLLAEGQRRVRALDPELVWLAHEHEPWRPDTV